MINDRLHNVLLVLVAVWLILHIYATWLEVKTPSSYKPAIWRDKPRGNICYIWRGTIFCMEDVP